MVGRPGVRLLAGLVWVGMFAVSTHAATTTSATAPDRVNVDAFRTHIEDLTQHSGSVQFEEAFALYAEEAQKGEMALPANEWAVMCVRIAHMFLNASNAERGLEYAEKAIAAATDPLPSALNAKAKGLLALGKAQEALKTYIDAITAAHSDFGKDVVEGCLGVANVFILAERHADAITWLRHAVNADVNRSESWTLLGLAYMRNSSVTPAISCFDNALQLSDPPEKSPQDKKKTKPSESTGPKSDPSMPHPAAYACYNLAKALALRASGKDTHKITLSEAMVPKGAEGPSRAHRHADDPNKQRIADLEDARALYERALTLDPSFPPTYLNLGNLLLFLEDKPKALEVWEKGISKLPHSRAVLSLLVNAGTLCSEMDREHDAVEYYSRVLDLDDSLDAVWYNKAMLCARLNRPVESGAALARAAKLRPDLYGKVTTLVSSASDEPVSPNSGGTEMERNAATMEMRRLLTLRKEDSDVDDGQQPDVGAREDL